ncbi:MAG: hypothetical protein JXA77_15990 [Bacteroidales bacterium]|nr:hypothetical protein [Bacteroidales bacterium]MBN2817486.1 hypothetical protein [Bacteroidales bacterium]
MKYFYKQIAKVSLLIVVLALNTSCDFLGFRFEKPSGKKIVKEYHSNGKIKSVNEVEGDLRDGLCKYYDENGTLISTIEFKENKYHGKYIKYYDGKHKMREATYVNHKKQGSTYIYDKKGILIVEENYENDELNGIKRKYYLNGKLKMENEYKDGRPSVNLKEYDMKGNLVTDYPEIIIEAVDRLAINNKYLLKFYFSNKSRTAEFYLGELEDNKYIPANLIAIETQNGVGTYEVWVPKGSLIMKEISVIGKKKTTENNTYITTKKYNLAVKN